MNTKSEPDGLKLNWLHISDTHLLPDTRDSYEDNKILDALLDTLQENASDWQPDIIFFTGDLANQGKDYKKARIFFDKLLDATGLRERYHDQAEEFLHIVPGNHDVDRDYVKFLKRPLDTQMQSSEFFSQENTKQRRPFFARFHAFQEFVNTYFKNMRHIDERDHWYTDILPIKKGNYIIKIGVVGLNSAWFSQDDNDEHQLWIGERVCDEAFKNLQKKCDLIFVLQHHPQSFLHLKDEIKGIVSEKADIWLIGHIHKDEAEKIINQSGEILVFQAGSACTRSEHPSRALCGTIDLSSSKVTIKPICFKSVPPRRWVLDTSLFPYPHTKEFDLSKKFCLETCIDGATSNTLKKGSERAEIDVYRDSDQSAINLSKIIYDISDNKSLIKNPNLQSNFTGFSPDLFEIQKSGLSNQFFILSIENLKIGNTPNIFPISEIAQSSMWEIQPFTELQPSEAISGEPLSASPIKSLSEVEEYFIELERVKEMIEYGTIDFNSNYIFMDVHGSGKTSLLAYLSKRSLDQGHVPFWIDFSSTTTGVDLQALVEETFIKYSPEKPILVFDAVERHPVVVKNIISLKKGIYCDIPVWISVASEELDSIKEDISVLENEFQFEMLPMPGFVTNIDVDSFINRIKRDTTQGICDFLKEWAENANPGLMLESYRVIIDSKKRRLGENGLKQEISRIARDSGARYEDMFNHNLDQHMRETLIYVAAIGEVDVELLNGVVKERFSSEDRDLVDILCYDKRLLFVKEMQSLFDEKSLRLVYLHDGLRRVALSKGNYDQYKAKEIAKILVNLSSDPVIGGKACVALSKLYIKTRNQFPIITENIYSKLSGVLLSKHSDPRKYWTAAILAIDFPELVNLWERALANCENRKIWTTILDMFGVCMTKYLHMHEKVKIILSKAVSIDPENLDALNHLVQECMFLEDYELATSILESAPSGVKETNKYLKIQAKFFIKQGKLDEAYKILAALFDASSSDPEILLNLIRYYCDKNDLDNAKSLLIKALHLEPENSNLIQRLLYVESLQQGIADYSASGNDTTAIIKNLLKDLPSSRLLLSKYAVNLATLGEIDEARRIWERILEKDPNDIDSLVNLSIYHMKNGAINEAKPLLIQAMKLEPRNIEIIARLVGLERRARGIAESPEESSDTTNAMLSIIDDLLKISPNNHILLSDRGHYLYNLNKKEEAISIWQELLEDDPRNIYVLMNLIDHYVDNKDESKANTHIIQAVKMNPSDQELVLDLIISKAKIQCNQMPIDDERELAEKLLDATDTMLIDLPYNFWLLNARGEFLSRIGRIEEAFDIWQSLLKNDPNNAEIIQNLIRHMISNKQFDEAEPLIKNYLNQHPEEDFLGFIIATYAHAFEGGELAGKIDPILNYINKNNNEPRYLYNLACGYALIKNKTGMLWALKLTRLFGENISNMAKEDTDFGYYKEDPDFLAVINGAIEQ